MCDGRMWVANEDDSIVMMTNKSGMEEIYISV